MLNLPQTRGPAQQPDGYGILPEGPPLKKLKKDQPAMENTGLHALTYVVNVMEGLRRVVPPITLHHTDGRRTSIFYTLLTHLAEKGLFGIIEVYTAEGMALISDEESWVAAIRAVDEDEAMDRTVRVRIQIMEPAVFS